MKPLKTNHLHFYSAQELLFLQVLKRADKWPKNG